MAVNFTLSYNDGLQYVDLFLQTNLSSIIVDNLFQINTYSVNVPATTSTVQNIDITEANISDSSLFRIYMLSNNQEDISNYSTINQAQILNNELILTRFNDKPTNSINIIIMAIQEIN